MVAFSCPSFRKLALAVMDCFVLHGRKEVYSFLARVACFRIILQIAKGGTVFI